MSTQRHTLNAIMRSLVDQLGGVDASSAIISERWSRPVSKGTISRRLSGEWDWTVCDIIALQEAAQRRPVYDWFESFDGSAAAKEDAMAAAAFTNVEFGQANAALMTAKTPEDRARAAKEWRDVAEGAERVIDALEGGR